MIETTGGQEPPDITSKPSEPQSMDIRTHDLPQKTYDLNNKYRPGDSGPYFVYVEHENKNIGRLFPVRVGHYLFNNLSFKNNVTDIKSIGLNRVKIIFKDYASANLLVNHDIMKNNNLIAYIPKIFTHKKGVIKMIDTYFDEGYLKEHIVSTKEIVEVQRLKRRVVDSDGTVKYIPRQIIVATFLGNSIPVSVQINLCNFIVEPYVYPVVQCYRCLRFGHTAKQCKDKKDKCKKCSQVHVEPDICESQMAFCIHCKTNEHPSLSRLCPAYKKQYSIKKIMAMENTSFKEAETLVNNPSYSKIVTNNKFAILNDLNTFPPLPTNSENKINSSYQISSNRQSNLQKKRKTISPSRYSIPPPPKKVPEINPTKSTPIIPNPYREEFKQYKDKLIFQLSNYINNIISNIYAESNTKLNVQDDHETQVREFITSILGAENNIEVYSLSNCSEF